MEDIWDDQKCSWSCWASQTDKSEGREVKIEPKHHCGGTPEMQLCKEVAEGQSSQQASTNQGFIGLTDAFPEYNIHESPHRVCSSTHEGLTHYEKQDFVV